MPTRNHVGLPYNMGYDLYPLDNVETKRKLLSDAAEQGWIVVIDHEPDEPTARVILEKDDSFRLEPTSRPGDTA